MIQQAPEPVAAPLEALSTGAEPGPEPLALRLAGQDDDSSHASSAAPSSEVSPVSDAEEVTSMPVGAEPESLHFAEHVVPPVTADAVSAKIAEPAPAPPVSQDTSIADKIPLPQVLRQVTEHEYRVHYELGMAYKNMGMLDEAVEEFEVAINGKESFLEGATLLSACLKEKGLLEPAMECLERVLADPQCDYEKAVPIRYELGMLYESDGLSEKAMEMFSTIATFLDVPMRLERLKGGHAPQHAEGDAQPGEPTTVAASNAPPTERKKRRISYL